MLNQHFPTNTVLHNTIIAHSHAEYNPQDAQSFVHDLFIINRGKLIFKNKNSRCYVIIVNRYFDELNSDREKRFFRNQLTESVKCCIVIMGLRIRVKCNAALRLSPTKRSENGVCMPDETDTLIYAQTHLASTVPPHYNFSN